MLNKSETLLAGNKLVCNIPYLIKCYDSPHMFTAHVYSTCLQHMFTAHVYSTCLQHMFTAHVYSTHPHTHRYKKDARTLPRTHTPSHKHSHSPTCTRALSGGDKRLEILVSRDIIIHTMSHHHTYYVTSSYMLCHIIIHTMSHHHSY